MARYNKISKNIQQVIIDNPKIPNEELIWINVFDASRPEMEFLRKTYNFNLGHLQASSAKTFAQRPTIDQGSGYIFLILHFPFFENGQVMAKEIDFFISHGYLVTVHNNDVNIINDFFNLCKKDGDSFLAYEYQSSAVLLYEFLEKLMLACYPMLDQISIELSKIEETIFTHEQKDAVTKILALRHNILNFRKIMQNHKNIIKKLIELGSTLIDDNNKRYYKTLIEHTKTIWEILENQKETINILYQTNESLLSYKMTDIMKTLTIFSVIVFPLTLLAAIFGMNVTSGMPLVEMKHGFWVIVAVMATASLFMLLFFERKKWL